MTAGGHERSRRTRSAAETRRLAARLGERARPGDVIGLAGELGAGKTCFVQGLARGLGVPDEERVASPSFNIVLTHAGRLPLHHVDLYRVGGAAELAELGVEELLHEGGVAAVEWLERAPEVAPRDHLEVRILVEGPRARRLRVRAFGPRSRELLSAWLGKR